MQVRVRAAWPPCLSGAAVLQSLGWSPQSVATLNDGARSAILFLTVRVRFAPRPGKLCAGAAKNGGNRAPVLRQNSAPRARAPRFVKYETVGDRRGRLPLHAIARAPATRRRRVRGARRSRGHATLHLHCAHARARPVPERAGMIVETIRADRAGAGRLPSDRPGAKDNAYR